MSIQNDEKVAIKTYCTVARQIEQAKMAFSRDIREQKAQVDANRANLFELMKATGIECMPFDGGYARIKVNNSMRAVTKDVVSDALQLLTREMVEEEKSDNPESSARDVLVGCILKLIQSRRTKSKEFVEFSKFKPKNFNLSNQAINGRVTEACERWQTSKKKMDEVKKSQKDATKNLVEQQKQCEGLVRQFMERAELTSQRININERDGRTQTYFIKNKVSNTKPRITKDLIQKSVATALADVRSVEEVLRRRTDIATSIFELLENRPVTSKKCVKLVKGMLSGSKRKQSD